jgi:hypothetical protein
MGSSILRLSRWIVGSAVFVAVAAILFEGAGQSSPRPASVRANSYRPVSIDDREVRTALTFALADQQRKNRSGNSVTLLRVLTAERQASNSDNFRVCLSLDRRGRTDTARAILHRNQNRHWTFALWAWGACGKSKI